ncbi:FAD:protein FMN transferase [uncultured Pseudokineococcus sp.]|uniref:FAD:protein FMN transferase n=1 Tax=uncultured Pseudokineococcus sp. TaxID=1642928 RepID=UPI00262F58CA|nr:FAD:protein FMN transferase [uncultured Pseudokineococcus sp.]
MSPLVERLPVTAAVRQWSVWSTTARVVLRGEDADADPGAPDRAAALVAARLAAVDAACSRFRADSELARAEATGGPVEVSPLLADLVATALEAARRTDGDVDPTLAAALDALGYDRDWSLVGTSAGVPVRVPTQTSGARPTRGWRDVELDGRVLRVPSGVRLDLGATAKERAADLAAADVAAALGVGVLVALGGDVATAGPAPEGGWRVRVQDDGPRGPGPATTVRLGAGGALATSSTRSRTWTTGTRHAHHLLDPRSGLPVETVWATASVAAASCVEAGTATTAALVRGRAGAAWLAALRVPARLVDDGGRVELLGGWPDEHDEPVHRRAVREAGDEGETDEGGAPWT